MQRPAGGAPAADAGAAGAVALSHLPLDAVPVGAVNVHGHRHDGTKPSHRHVNLTVEMWDYEPVRMTTIAARARKRDERRIRL